MSDVLASLVGRALGVAPQLRPLHPAYRAPAGAPEPEPEPVWAAPAQNPAPPAALEPARPRAAEPLPAPLAVPHASAPAFEHPLAPPADVPKSAPAPFSPVMEVEQNVPTPVPVLPTEPKPRVVFEERAISAPRPAPRSAESPVAAGPAPVAAPAIELPGVVEVNEAHAAPRPGPASRPAAPQPVSVSWDSTVTVEMIAPPHGPVRTGTHDAFPQAVPSVAPPAAEVAPMPVAPQPPVERNVQVTIGRLEVRVNAPPAAKPKPPAAPAGPSLGEYLRRRAGGDR